MNSYQLKITGAAELPSALEADKEIAIHTSLSCYEVSKRDLQDGNFDIIYKCKISAPVDFIQGEKRMVSKDKTKASQKLRWAIEAKGKSLGVEDLEEWYQSEINKIISNYNQV